MQAPAVLPPEHLRFRVAGSADEEWFLKSGALSVADLGRALAGIGKSLDDFGDILDWGCGCGRMLIHVARVSPALRLSGCDIDAEAIEWLQRNMPGLSTAKIDGLPPMPYADGSFDLVYNHSVMSHLDETYQNAWLSELERVVRPGGIVTLSIHGPHAFHRWLSELPVDSPEREVHAAQMRTNGFVYRSDDAWSNGPFPDFYHTSYHAVSYVFDNWSRYFDILAYLPRGALQFQDLVVLQRRAASQEAPSPRAPRRSSRRTKLAAAWALMREAVTSNRA